MPRVSRPASVTARPTRHSGAVASDALVFSTAYERNYDKYLADREQEHSLGPEESLVSQQAPPEHVVPALAPAGGDAALLNLANATRDHLRADEPVVLDAQVVGLVDPLGEVAGTQPASETGSEEEEEEEEVVVAPAAKPVAKPAAKPVAKPAAKPPAKAVAKPPARAAKLDVAGAVADGAQLGAVVIAAVGVAGVEGD